MDLIDRGKLIKAIGINKECEDCQYVAGKYLCGCDIPQVDICEAIAEAPTIKTKQIKYFDEDESVWKIGEVIVDEETDHE